jgi:replicative DNA helicase
MTDRPKDVNDLLREGKLPASPDQAPHLRLVEGPRDMGDDSELIAEEEAKAPPPEVRKHAFTMKELLEGLWLQAQAQKEVPSISMCHGELDDLIGGFRPKHITTLGAVTSWGKSTWAIMVVDEAIKDGKRALIVTTEDARDMYARRFAARRGNLNSDRLKANKLEPDELSQLAYQVEQAQDIQVLLEAVGKPIEWICKAIRSICSEEPYDLIVLDYLQCTTTPRESDSTKRVSLVARDFADVVKEVGASGLMLSQLRRLEDGKRPTMHDLKYAGDVENISEHILLGHIVEAALHAGEAPSRQHYMGVKKNKDGSLSRSDVIVPWNATSASFMACQ